MTNDYRLTLLTDSSNSITPVGSIVSFSDDDLPLCSDQEDKRKVQRRDLDDDVPPGPTEVPEYIPMPRQKPVEIHIYTPTPCDQLVKYTIRRVRPADDRMFDPMLGEWPVDDQSGTEKTQKNTAGGQTLRKFPVDTLVRKPIPREKPSGEKPYGLRPRDRLVEVPKLKGRPVDGWEYEPLNRERPADSGAKDGVFEEWPVDNPKPRARPVGVRTEAPRSEMQPVDDTSSEWMSRNGPVADPRIAIGPVPPITNELKSQDEGCANQTSIRRLDGGDGTVPTTGGGPDTGPKTILSPQGGEAISEPAPQLHQAPPPSEVPDWSDGEAMPLIIIDNSPVMPAPTKTIKGLLVDSDDMLPLSHEMNSSGDPGVLSAPLSPNRVRKGHSQDMPAEGSLFDVSPDIPGFPICPVPQYSGNGYHDDVASLQYTKEL